MIFNMKKIFQYALLMLIIASCNKKNTDNSIAIPVSNTIAISDSDTNDSIVLKAAHVVPTVNQYDALKNEFIAFIHFGPNTFTRMEWGNGMEDPKIFNLQNLDTDQWCKTMKDAQMKMVIITVKHHDGFVLWQSRYTKHGIMSSPFQSGKGDILKDLSESCKKYGLKLGVYLSPADLYQIENKKGLYGNLSKYTERIIPKPVKGRPFKNKATFKFKVDDYNEYFLNQLFELLTEYGPIHEVWFDGAHPKRKGGQKYNYLAWKELIHTLAPKAVVFGKQDIRWCGNESGATRNTEWNIIPYEEDPGSMSSFADIMQKDIGSRDKLYKAKYLHYQQAETNTSIREGWFYRDDTGQKVRSADDVFDIYERSVGGNSTFLLNIPPNRKGEFSATDIAVLKEVGQRIHKTYANNLFKKASGPKKILDNNANSFVVLNKDLQEIIIETSKPVTVNRFIIQEAIATHGERVEKHALDAWVHDEWKEIVTSTNIGYKRILRFPEVTSNKFRLRVLESRYYPVISNISAHYYNSRAPELSIERNFEGMVTIKPKKHNFRWKPHGEDASANINAGLKIRYTIDGSKPNKTSKLYTESFLFPLGEVKAFAEIHDENGPEVSHIFGSVKKDWKLLSFDSEKSRHGASNAFDGFKNSYWQTYPNKKNEHYISIDLGKEYKLTGFSYTPQKEHADGMIEKGIIKISKDGEKWQTLEEFTFGNLINDPVIRRHNFKSAVDTRYISIESKVIAGGKNTAAIAELDFFK